MIYQSLVNFSNIIVNNHISIACLSQTVSVGRRRFSASFQLMFRLIKGLIFMTFIAIIVILITLAHMTIQDIIVCILAFMPTGWGMLLVSKKKLFVPIRKKYCVCFG